MIVFVFNFFWFFVGFRKKRRNLAERKKSIPRKNEEKLKDRGRKNNRNGGVSQAVSFSCEV